MREREERQRERGRNCEINQFAYTIKQSYTITFENMFLLFHPVRCNGKVWSRYCLDKSIYHDLRARPFITISHDLRGASTTSQFTLTIRYYIFTESLHACGESNGCSRLHSLLSTDDSKVFPRRETVKRLTHSSFTFRLFIGHFYSLSRAKLQQRS